jgi:vacuolar protein sorting-associated protein VTA1
MPFLSRRISSRSYPLGFPSLSFFRFIWMIPFLVLLSYHSPLFKICADTAHRIISIMLSIPPDLKKITPYVRRAEELDKDQSSPESRLVAYYSRQYAVKLGIPLASSSPEAKTCLGQLLEDLETEKAAMDNFTWEEAAFLCRKFSNKVFDKADGEDRMGMANKNTAKAFYAAASFLQILEQFYDKDDTSEASTEDKKRIIYAKWKATEILKAVKEGRTPVSGGYGEEEEDAEEEEEEGTEQEIASEENKEDAPMVETVTVEDDDDEEDSVDPPVEVAPPDEESEEEEEDSTEVELGAPPAYSPPPTSFDPSKVNRPPVSYSLPPPVVPPALPAAPSAPPAKKAGGMFGFGGKKKGEKITKAQLADAVELTRFALASLEDKDGELGAERLQQALDALGR